MEDRTATTLYGFCKTNTNHLIVDSWMNIACPSDECVRRSKRQLDKWQSEGRRVAWAGPDGNAKGWYAPALECKPALQRRTLTLHAY